MDINILKNLVRTGKISSVDAVNNTARVVFEDKDNDVSGDLIIVNRGSMNVKDYWMPDVDEQVVCLFLPNTKAGLKAGFVLGSFFSSADAPQVGDANKRRIDFDGASYIEFDRATGGLTINCKGPIVLKGSTISLN